MLNQKVGRPRQQNRVLRELSGILRRSNLIQAETPERMNAANGTFLQPYLGVWLPFLYASSYWWTVLGFIGNLLFSSRFVVQWLASEKSKRVVVPAHFWHLSFWGSVINLLYAFHIDNAPIIFGVIALPFIYGRNLFLLYSPGSHSTAPARSVKRPVWRARPA